MIQHNLDHWGIDCTNENTTQEHRIVLDKIPAQAERAGGWTAQAGMETSATLNIVSGDDGHTLDCGPHGRFRVVDIEHDGHGWSVLDLAEPAA